MKQFVQNKSQAKKLLEDQITYKCSGNAQGLKKQTNKQTNKTMNAFLPIRQSKTVVQIVIPKRTLYYQN